VKTRPDADCGSDHELLTATVRIKLKNTQVKKGWKLDADNIPEDYEIDIKQKLATLNIEGGNSEETLESFEGHFQGGGRQKHSEKEKGPHLDIPRYTEGRGEQETNENGRKVGRSKEAKRRNTKKN
jgi:hypothetical protein